MKTLLLSLFIFSTHAFSNTTFHVVAWNIERSTNEAKKRKAFKEDFKDVPIIALQEFKEPLVSKFAEEFGYDYVVDGTDVIFSKFPIVRSGGVEVNPETGRSAAWADIKVDNKTLVRVYSPHLSYKVKRSPFIKKIRKEEMRRLVEHSNTFNGPSIVAGDYNTVGFFLGGQSREPLLDVIEDAGYKNTSKDCRKHTQRAGKIIPIGRVDWIFSRDIKSTGCKSGDFDGSDHRWIRSTFETE